MNDLRCLGGSKTQNGRFVSKNCTSLEENQSATKFLCVNTVSDKVVKKASQAYPCKNGSLGMFPSRRPLLRENLAEIDQLPSKNADNNRYLLVAPQP